MLADVGHIIVVDDDPALRRRAGWAFKTETRGGDYVVWSKIETVEKTVGYPFPA